MQDVQERQWPSTLLSAEQVQVMLGVDKSTVYRMAADGRLAAIKVGRQWRFPLEPIQALLDGAGVTRGTLPFASMTPAHSDLRARRDAALQPIIDLAAEMLGVMMVVTDMDGNPLSDVANPCPWFTARKDDPEVLASCVRDWRGLADDMNFEPHLAEGSHGFECARAFLRDGDRLVGMVLAGGVAPLGGTEADLYCLDDEARSTLVSTLPRIATTISRVVSRPTNPTRSNS
jgi:excisionase family DNA binding protein